MTDNRWYEWKTVGKLSSQVEYRIERQDDDMVGNPLDWCDQTRKVEVWLAEHDTTATFEIGAMWSDSRMPRIQMYILGDVDYHFLNNRTQAALLNAVSLTTQALVEWKHG